MSVKEESSKAMDRLRCFRTTLVALNVVFILIGGVALGAGIWVLVEHDDLMYYLNQQTSDIGTLMTSIVCQLLFCGVASIVVAVVGFYQSRKPSKRLLYIYTGVVLFVAGSASSLFYTLMFTSTLSTDLNSHMRQLLENTYSSHVSADGAGGAYEYSCANDGTLATDIVQLKFGCCGVINGSDFSNATSWDRKVSGSNATMVIPATCCQMTGTVELSSILKKGSSGNLSLVNSTCLFTSYDSNISTGCYNAVYGTLKTIFRFISSIGYSAVVVQAATLIIVPLLYRSEFKYKVMP